MRRLASTLTLPILAAACASVPPATSEIERARAAYVAAAANPVVQARAPVELQRAGYDAIEQCAIVRDQKQCAREPFDQVLLEPLDGLGPQAFQAVRGALGFEQRQQAPQQLPAVCVQGERKDIGFVGVGIVHVVGLCS